MSGVGPKGALLRVEIFISRLPKGFGESPLVRRVYPQKGCDP